eukprot:maker-scaffold645_size120276-snap-gene-0.39 protein:Tk11127 transcript:maker-scaffold645_size120276-snap-gene-0.39-mRNA-1 annotation:"nuclear pore complex protein nup93"
MTSVGFPSTDFGDLLQSAEQLTAQFAQATPLLFRASAAHGGAQDLPRVERNWAQLVEAGQRLLSQAAPGRGPEPGARDEEAEAAILMGARGVDLPQLKAQLASLSRAGHAQAAAPLDPLPPTDIAGFLRNERENAILSVIEETRADTLAHVERRHWGAVASEWADDKRRILQALGGPQAPGSDLLELTRAIRPERSRAHDSTLHAGRSTLDHVEVGYAREVTRYNEAVAHGAGSRQPDLVGRFAGLARPEADPEGAALWAIVAALTGHLGVPPPQSDRLGPWRASAPLHRQVVRAGQDYLERDFKKYVTTTVFSHMSQAQLGGIPGTYQLVRSFLKVQIAPHTPGLEDGLIDGVPVWALIYYALRCGDLSASVQAAHQAGPGLADMAKFLTEMQTSVDQRLSPHSDNIVKLAYRRSIRSTTDPFKRAVYCLLGACDPSDEHSEIATSLDDYLWLKFYQIRGEDEVASSHALDHLTLTKLQVQMSEEYGESHFNAYEKPLLYFQVLFLTGQFETAIEFLFRASRFRPHAVHIALALYEMNLLLLPNNIQAALLSKESADRHPLKRINIARLIMLYVKKFEGTDPKEALQYFYFLRNERGTKHENLFMSCVSALVLESREFDLLLGLLTPDGTRAPGLIDRLQNSTGDTQRVIELVAQDSEQKGMFEDSVKLYDLARKHDKVIELLNKLLAQVIAQPSAVESRRERLQRQAVDVAKRYRTLGHGASQATIESFYLLLDLMTFFDLYHVKKYDEAMETLAKLKIVPLVCSEIDLMVANFRLLPEEIRRNIPDLLLSAMSVLFTQYKLSKSSTPGRGLGQDGGRERLLDSLREKAKSLITYAGMIPYRMPGDTNARLVQMENPYLEGIDFEAVLSELEDLNFELPPQNEAVDLIRALKSSLIRLRARHPLENGFDGKEAMGRALGFEGVARKLARVEEVDVEALIEALGKLELDYADKNIWDDILEVIWNVIVWWIDQQHLNDCEKALWAILLDTPGVQSSYFRRPEWAWRMIDATGKLGGSGFFDGNLNALGSYDECLPIHVMASDARNYSFPHGKFAGAYMLGRLSISSSVTPPDFNFTSDPELLEEDQGSEKFYHTYLSAQAAQNRLRENVIVLESPYHEDYGVDWSLLDIILGTLFQRPHLGLCLPSVCEVPKVEKALEDIIQEVLEFFVQNDTINYPFAYEIGTYRYTEQTSIAYTGGDIACLLILLFFVLLVVVGTCMELYGYRDDKADHYKSRPVKVMLCFSLYTNGGKLFNTEKTKSNIDCINGLRVFSMAWVIFGHTYWVAGGIPWENPFAIGDMFRDWYMNVVFEGLFAVDTFFTLGGFLMAFLTIKELDKRKGKINIPFLYLHRFCRLTPLYGIVILFVSTLLLHMGQGPFWMYIIDEGTKCAQYWWYNILYINNFIDQSQMCMEVSWYLAVDFQLFLIGPPLVWIMWKFKRVGLAVAIALLAVSCAVPGIMTGVNDWPPVVTLTIVSLDWMSKFYVRPYNRAAPYIWGIIFGYIMHHLPKKYHRREGTKLPWYLILGGWLISSAICLCCIFGLTTKWYVNFACIVSEDCYTTADAVLFAAFARLAWAIGISWVIFACQTGYAGFVAHILSYSVWNPMSRMTFACYLIHLPMIYAFHKSRKSIMHFDNYFMQQKKDEQYSEGADDDDDVKEIMPGEGKTNQAYNPQPHSDDESRSSLGSDHDSEVIAIVELEPTSKSLTTHFQNLLLQLILETNQILFARLQLIGKILQLTLEHIFDDSVLLRAHLISFLQSHQR